MPYTINIELKNPAHQKYPFFKFLEFNFKSLFILFLGFSNVVQRPAKRSSSLKTKIQKVEDIKALR